MGKSGMAPDRIFNKKVEKVSGFLLDLDGWLAVGKVNRRYVGIKEIGFNTLDTR